MASYDEIKFIKFWRGTSIEDACKEAIRISSDENCIVKFNFNGIEMSVDEELPDVLEMKSQRLVDKYYQKNNREFEED